MITQENITFAIAILAAIFAVYSYFRKPQDAIEKQQIRSEEDIKDKASILDQRAVENKAEILAKQFQWNMEAVEKRFSDFGIRLDKSYEMAANHTHAVDVKVDQLIGSVNRMSNEITRLSTIIEERNPKKS